MSTRTIIEINHDHLTLTTAAEIIHLLSALGQARLTGMLNQNDGAPITWASGIRVLAQRHHSETLNLEIK